MAGYRANQSIECWKQHRCVGCGGLYRYLFKRKCSIYGITPEKAEAGAREHLEKQLKTSADLRPCPHCGAYQPDMMAQRRLGFYTGVSVIVWGTVIGVLIVSLIRTIGIPTLALVAGVLVALAVVSQMWIAWRDDNANLAANRRAAESAIRKGKMQLNAPGVSGQPGPEARWRRPGLALLALLAVGALLVPSAELVRRIAHWPLNEAFYPPVAGPGDETTYYLSTPISSIKGYWRGQPVVRLTNADELGVANAEIVATTNQKDWGKTISATKEEKDSISTPWVRFTVPREPALADKIAKLHFALHAEYPQMMFSSNYTTREEDFLVDASLALAAAGAGKLYVGLWYVGMPLGGILLAVATWKLRQHAKAQNRSTLAGIFQA